MVARALPSLKSLRLILLAGATAALLGACATNNTSSFKQPDFSQATPQQKQQAIAGLGARYKAQPNDKTTILYYSAALRSAGQAEQAVSVVEAGI